MNIQIFPEMMKWKNKIDEHFGGPMFFLYDNELVNMYECLSRLSDKELQILCNESKFQKMCSIITGERKSDFGSLSGYVNDRGMLNIEGLLPILRSFPSFNDAMNFIMRIKPGFRYTSQFQKFVEENITITEMSQTINLPGLNIINESTINDRLYTLDNYEYHIYNTKNMYRIQYFKDQKMHRINGPAEITLTANQLWLSWYRNGKLYYDKSQPSDILYLAQSENTKVSKNNKTRKINIVHHWRKYINKNDMIIIRTLRFYNDELVTYSLTNEEGIFTRTYDSNDKFLFAEKSTIY